MTAKKSTKKCAARTELTVCIGFFYQVHLLLICLDHFRFFYTHLELRSPQSTVHVYTLRYCRYKTEMAQKSSASRSIKC